MMTLRVRHIGLAVLLLCLGFLGVNCASIDVLLQREITQADAVLRTMDLQRIVEYRDDFIKSRRKKEVRELIEARLETAIAHIKTHRAYTNALHVNTLATYHAFLSECCQYEYCTPGRSYPAHCIKRSYPLEGYLPTGLELITDVEQRVPNLVLQRVKAEYSLTALLEGWQCLSAKKQPYKRRDEHLLKQIDLAPMREAIDWYFNDFVPNDYDHPYNKEVKPIGDIHRIFPAWLYPHQGSEFSQLYALHRLSEENLRFIRPIAAFLAEHQKDYDLNWVYKNNPFAVASHSSWRSELAKINKRLGTAGITEKSQPTTTNESELISIITKESNMGLRATALSRIMDSPMLTNAVLQKAVRAIVTDVEKAVRATKNSYAWSKWDHKSPPPTCFEEELLPTCLRIRDVVSRISDVGFLTTLAVRSGPFSEHANRRLNEWSSSDDKLLKKYTRKRTMNHYGLSHADVQAMVMELTSTTDDEAKTALRRLILWRIGEHDLVRQEVIQTLRDKNPDGNWNFFLKFVFSPEDLFGIVHRRPDGSFEFVTYNRILNIPLQSVLALVGQDNAEQLLSASQPFASMVVIPENMREDNLYSSYANILLPCIEKMKERNLVIASTQNIWRWIEYPSKRDEVIELDNVPSYVPQLTTKVQENGCVEFASDNTFHVEIPADVCQGLSKKVSADEIMLYNTQHEWRFRGLAAVNKNLLSPQVPEIQGVLGYTYKQGCSLEVRKLGEATNIPPKDWLNEEKIVSKIPKLMLKSIKEKRPPRKSPF